MSFSFGKFFTDIADSTTYNSIINNPIYSAVVITLIIMIIIYFMYRDAYEDDEDNSFWTVFLRSGIYILLANLGIVYLHYNSLDREYEQKHSIKLMDKAVSGTTNNGIAGAGEGIMDVDETPITANIRGQGEGGGASNTGEGMNITIRNPSNTPLNLTVGAAETVTRANLEAFDTTKALE